MRCLLAIRARACEGVRRAHPPHWPSASELAGLRKTEYTVVKILRVVVTVVSTSGLNWVMV